MKYIFWILTFLITSSCANIFNDAVNKTTDAGRLHQARMFLSSGNWNSAIAQFNLLSTTTLNQTPVLVDYASAYAGRCGLNFLTMADELQNLGASNLMTALLPVVPTTVLTTAADCVTCESLLTPLSTNCVVSDNLGKILAAFNALAKISSILNFYADADEDGVVDAGWDACGAGGLANLPDADLNEIVTAFYIFINNAAGLAVGSSIGSTMLATCEAVLGAGNCNKCTVGTVTNADRWLMRGMIVETDDAIGLSIRAGSAAMNAADPQCQL